MVRMKEHTLLFSDEDWNTLTALAKASCRSNSAYVRSLIYFRRPKDKPSTTWKIAYKALAETGNNLNQIAKYLHSGLTIDEDKLKECIDFIYLLKKEMQQELLPEEM